jgi:hypothetical protein
MKTVSKAIIILCFITITISFISFCHSYKLKVDKLNAPTWANFSSLGDMHERFLATNPSGIPYSVSINGEQWTIAMVDHFTQVEGLRVDKAGHILVPKTGIIKAETFCDNKTIVYVDDKDMNQLKVDLMHEIFHAGGCLHGGDDYWNSIDPTESNHPGIYHLGEFTASFMRANPRFTEWVSQ